MKRNILYVGLDVHKNTIEVAIAEDCAEGEVRSYGKINSSLEALNKLIRKIKAKGSKLQFVYEAGPCGYDIYRYLNFHQMQEYRSIADEVMPVALA